MYVLQEDSVQTAEMLINFANREIIALLLLVSIGGRVVSTLTNKMLTMYYGATTGMVVQSTNMFLSWVLAILLYYIFWGSGLGKRLGASRC